MSLRFTVETHRVRKQRLRRLTLVRFPEKGGERERERSLPASHLNKSLRPRRVLETGVSDNKSITISFNYVLPFS